MEHVHPLLGEKGGSYRHWLLFGERTVFIVNNCCSVGVYLISAPFYNWVQNPRGTLSFCCLCQNAQPMPSRVTEMSNSDGSPAWEIPRT